MGTKKFKNLIANIAQVILILIISMIALPIMAPVLKLKHLALFVVEFIPAGELWVELLLDAATFEMGDLIYLYMTAFAEAFIMGVCVKVASDLFSNMSGTKILPIFLGIFVGAMLVWVMGIQKSVQMILYVLILLLGILLIIKGVFTSISILPIKKLLTILADSLVALIFCGYLSAIVLFLDGNLSMRKLLWMTSAAMAAALAKFAYDD